MSPFQFRTAIVLTPIVAISLQNSKVSQSRYFQRTCSASWSTRCPISTERWTLANVNTRSFSRHFTSSRWRMEWLNADLR